MSNILGDPAMIEWGESQPAGNKQVYINWEALRELPPQYAAVLTPVRFDPKMIGKKDNPDWTNIVGNKYMPTTSMYYRIAEACGISGDSSKVEPLYENVDINPLYCKDMLETPIYRKIKTGVTVTKQSKMLRSDGMFELSSACSNTYNAWDRCNNAWLKEEKDTDGYTHNNNWGKEGKYKTVFARKLHLSDELKFADQKSESKAHCKTIRELAGLPTAFEKADLMGGVLLFSKIVRSEESLQMEQLAYLTRIEKSTKSKVNTKLLFGDTEPEVKQVEEVNEPVKEPTQQEIALLDLLESYKALIGEDKALDGMINWLKDGNDYTSDANANFYSKIVANIKDIESRLDKDQLIPHNYR